MRAVSKELLEKVKEDNHKKNDILSALKGEAKTIPEIVAITGLPEAEVTWWLMTLRRYGSVVETGEIVDYSYYKYAQKVVK